MSNIIPPMVSSSPPPIEDAIEEDEDEFGDFAIADDSLNNAAGDSFLDVAIVRFVIIVL